ncbi:8 kDa subunit-domain-containing protein [Auriculariales sp. MPI-PUGE-AT-0066]|nr:8 kDa subunit-domain-containing protein [Auriculariales sp. MPI-PUGE-AT-0066]
MVRHLTPRGHRGFPLNPTLIDHPRALFSCGKVLGDKWNRYLELLATDKTEGEAMDALGLTRYCCRRMVLTHVDLIEKLLHYNPMERGKDRPRFDASRGEVALGS